jgi:Ni,Fe-hydrogenase maturation factor
VVVIGVEPVDISPFSLDLSPQISARIDDLVRMVIAEVEKLGVNPQKIV